MRNLSLDSIWAAQISQPQPPGVTPLPFPPIWDGVIIPASPAELFRRGQFTNVSLLLGTNLAENNLFLLNRGPDYPYNYTRELINENINFYSANNNVTLQEFYSAANYSTSDINSVFVDSTSAVIFVCPVRRFANIMSKAGNIVFHYSYDYVQPGSSSAWTNRTGHAGELGIVYNQNWNNNNEDRIMSSQIQNYWSRFIMYGDVNKAGDVDDLYAAYYGAATLPVWQQYHELDDNTLFVHNYNDIKPLSHFQIIHHSDWNQCNLWDKAIPPKRIY